MLDVLDLQFVLLPSETKQKANKPKKRGGSFGKVLQYSLVLLLHFAVIAAGC